MANIKRRNANGRERAFPPEAVDLFRKACASHPTYVECIRNAPACKSTNPAEHCTECRSYLDTSLALDRLLGLRPWQGIRCEAEGPAGMNEPELTAWWATELSAAFAVALADK
jgi:hypothetical protein